MTPIALNKWEYRHVMALARQYPEAGEFAVYRAVLDKCLRCGFKTKWDTETDVAAVCDRCRLQVTLGDVLWAIRVGRDPKTWEHLESLQREEMAHA